MQLFLDLALATVPSLIGQESRAIRSMEAMPAESVVSNLIEVGSPKVPSSFLIKFRVWGCWDLMP